MSSPTADVSTFAFDVADACSTRWIVAAVFDAAASTPA